MPDELTKALLLEEAASKEAIANALFTSVTGGLPLVHALVQARAVTSEVLGRYLARTDAPHLRHVVAVPELAERLPAGLCARLLAIPVRRDAITGTIDVVVADPGDEHPAREIGFHLRAPVRLVRAAPAAIEDALRRHHLASVSSGSPRRPRGDAASRDDDLMYDSRPRALASSGSGAFGGGSRSPSAAAPGRAYAVDDALDPMTAEALRPSRAPAAERRMHVVAPHSQARFDPAADAEATLLPLRETPAWGTPLPNVTTARSGTDLPPSGLGSEIPIPLTRRTFNAVSGGTQRPPALIDPAESPLGEGYPVDPAHVRHIVEVTGRGAAPANRSGGSRDMGSSAFIPGPPPVPDGVTGGYPSPEQSHADIGAILVALRAAGSRDEVLELVLTGARQVAFKVGIFVAKRGGYVGWACTPEFGERALVQSILVPVDSPSVFNEAVREGLYLGPIPHDHVHAALLDGMSGASRDVAVVPIRVSGKTAVVLVADELGDTMLATRRLEELARAAGDAFARIVRMRR